MVSIIQWNINGLRSHREELSNLIKEQQPSIICIQETKLHWAGPFSLRGYEIFRHDNFYGGNACGGTAVLLNSAVNAVEKNLTTPLQATCVMISAPIRLTLCSLYIPPAPATLSKEDLSDLITQLPRPFLLLGDFNAHHISWGSNTTTPRGNLVVSVLDDLNLVLLNNGAPTYLCPRTGSWSAIDLTICSPGLAPRLDWSVLSDLYGSDHAPIKVSIPSAGTCQLRRARWIVKKADWNSFQEKVNIPDMTNPLDIDTAVSEITNSVLTAARESIPKSSGLPKRPSVPWWTEECTRALCDRRKALRMFSKQPTQERLEAYRQKKAKARQVFKVSKRKSWLLYTESIARTTPASEVWRRLRSICGRPPAPPILGLKVGNNLITNPTVIADQLASSMADVSKTASYSLEFQRLKYYTESLPVNYSLNCNNPLNLPFSFEEMESAIADSPDSAPGPDDIHYAMLRNLPPHSKHNLLILFNRIFEGRVFPTAWRTSHIIPLLKPGQDKTLPSSYRPVSLTSCFCKILERMVNRRLVWYLEHNHLLSDQQCGFRQARSTMDLLVSLETTIRDAFLERRQVLAVFFDIRKAYDTAWRRGIVNTMMSWGIGGNILAFINGFMSDRSFQVRLGSTLSNVTGLENGVPQGSVLSCTLFAVAINSIVSCVLPPVRSSLFVDDFAVYVSARRLATAERSIQIVINRLQEWSGRTGFSFSPSKTRCILFTRLRNEPDPHINLNGIQIPVEQTIKFLGMTFDSRLTWIPHLKETKAKCLKRLNLLKALTGTRWGADRTCMLRFYKAFVRSCLDYGSQVYSSASPTALKMLDTIHHSAIRLATGAFRSSPVVSLLAECGEPPLVLRRFQLAASFYYTLKSNPGSPAHSMVLQSPFKETYRLKPQAQPPFGVRIQMAMSEFGIEDYQVRENYVSDVPPWATVRPSFVTSLLHFSKKTTSEHILRIAFREEISALMPCDVVYTDGSKSQISTGCAFVTASREYRFCLPPESSVYSAELTAIEKALNIVCPRTGRLVVCSDSLSSILALRDMYSKHVLVRSIQSAVHRLASQGVQVTLIWVPGHVGIIGNEIADRAARNALELPPFTREHISSDIKPLVRSSISNAWQTSWLEVTLNKLRGIKETVAPWGSSNRASRREEVVLCRLRIGHTLLTHGYLMSRGDPPLCAGCGEPLSVKHILVDCRDLKRLRKVCRLPTTLPQVLGDDENNIAKLFRFLNATSLMSRI